MALPQRRSSGTLTLHKGGKFTRGLLPPSTIPPRRGSGQGISLVLSTGRRLYHHHNVAQTGRSEGINDLLGEETADISVQDAMANGIADGEMILVKSRRGEVKVKARVTRQVPGRSGVMAFHFREACANWLTNP